MSNETDRTISRLRDELRSTKDSLNKCKDLCIEYRATIFHLVEVERDLRAKIEELENEAQETEERREL